MSYGAGDRDTVPEPIGAAPEPPVGPAEPVALIPLSVRTGSENELGGGAVVAQAASARIAVARKALLMRDIDVLRITPM